MTVDGCHVVVIWDCGCAAQHAPQDRKRGERCRSPQSCVRTVNRLGKERGAFFSLASLRCPRGDLSVYDTGRGLAIGALTASVKHRSTFLLNRDAEELAHRAASRRYRTQAEYSEIEAGSKRAANWRLLRQVRPKPRDRY